MHRGVLGVDRAPGVPGHDHGLAAVGGDLGPDREPGHGVHIGVVQPQPGVDAYVGHLLGAGDLGVLLPGAVGEAPWEDPAGGDGQQVAGVEPAVRGRDGTVPGGSPQDDPVLVEERVVDRQIVVVHGDGEGAAVQIRQQVADVAAVVGVVGDQVGDAELRQEPVLFLHIGEDDRGAPAAGPFARVVEGAGGFPVGYDDEPCAVLGEGFGEMFQERPGTDGCHDDVDRLGHVVTPEGECPATAAAARMR